MGSIREVQQEHGPFHAVIVATGAAVGALADAPPDLSLRLCQVGLRVDSNVRTELRSYHGTCCRRAVCLYAAVLYRADTVVCILLYRSKTWVALCVS